MRATLLAWALGLGATVSQGCLARQGYRCEADAQCDLDGRSGRCQSTGFCAYADEMCPSELRYEPDAGSDLGGRCVPPRAGGATGSSGGATGSSGGAGGSSSEEGPETTTGDSTSSSTSGSSTAAPEGTGGSGSGPPTATGATSG